MANPIARQPLDWKPNLDVGKDVENVPWLEIFKDERINHHPLTLAEKITAKG